MRYFFRYCLDGIRKILNAGVEHECPICKSRVRKFRRMGTRPSARCPVCGSLERHRLIWLYCRARTDLFDGRRKRLLHVAPEPCLTRELRRIDALEYVGADLQGHHAMVKMDVTAIQFGDASFDVILCNHVLEHVPEDGKAMRELRRVLKPGGWAIMQVPIKGETTQEDPAVTSAAERTRLYGQHDHVRQYGRDYAQRLRAAGFLVEVDTYAAGLTPSQRERYGVLADEDLYCCARSA
ncbi:MAG: methyltransferase domain-containing protein [Burkholderiales bacterium]|nr:methyltransferase domain-containing protein [Burkholderiales bacterium]